LNFLDFVKQQPEFWKGAASILDTVLTKGIDNSYTRAEREMIFAYISEDNGCEFCAIHHSDFARDIGFDDNFTKYTYVGDNIDKQKNVTYISAVAKMYNHLVEEFGITQVNDDNIMLKDTPVKYRGYTL
jgi:AhpD family alkylhydroperoxidase